MANQKKQNVGELQVVGGLAWVHHADAFPSNPRGDYQNMVTSINSGLAEAIDDCLEQMAQAGFKTEGVKARIMAQKGWKALPDTLPKMYSGNHANLYYHISIRWNPTEEQAMLPKEVIESLRENFEHAGELFDAWQWNENEPLEFELGVLPCVIAFLDGARYGKPIIGPLRAALENLERIHYERQLECCKSQESNEDEKEAQDAELPW